MATAPSALGSSDTTNAIAPSEMGQQSSSLRGAAIDLEASTSASAMGVRRCASGCRSALLRISTANSAKSAGETPVRCMYSDAISA
ncbi:hypothetical protein D3C78_1481710 [compost metagenome]